MDDNDHKAEETWDGKTSVVETDCKAEATAQEFLNEVQKSMDALSKRITEVTGLEGDDDRLVMGRVTFSPEVERRMAERKGMMPNHRGDGCVRTPTGRPRHRPSPSLEALDELMDAMKDGDPVPTPTTEDILKEPTLTTGDLPSAEELRRKHDAGWTLTPKARVKAGLDKHTPLPPKPEGTPHQPALSRKDTNPKDAVGTKKWRQYCTVPTTIIWELGVAMLEGARKYGRHNYRIAGVRASVYVDAAKGHIDQWWEGEDTDEESKLNHIIKAIASLAVLRDAMIHDKWVDDRPPKTDLETLRADLQVAVDGIFERIPVAKAAYLEGDQYDDTD